MGMPFGKYVGVEIADLPDDYLRWLHDNIELREPLRTTISNEYDRRFSPKKSKAPSKAVLTMATELITAGYRKLALAKHPDHGGDSKTMQLVNAAADFLRQAARAT